MRKLKISLLLLIASLFIGLTISEKTSTTPNTLSIAMCAATCW